MVSVVVSTDRGEADLHSSGLVEWDRAYEERTRRRNNLEEYCYSFRDAIDGLGKGVDKCLQWLDSTSSRSVSDAEFVRQEELLVALANRVLPPGYKLVRESSGSSTPGPR